MKGDWHDRWQGRTVICLASGPSLTPEDCETVRQTGHPVIVTNTTFRLAPWADVLFGFDGKWWREYRAEVEATFGGEKLTFSSAGPSLGVRTLHREAWFTHFHNSGASAISLAVVAGAARVLLLGYDCQKTGGKAHWHGDHPRSLGNAKSISNWPTQFRGVARYAKSKGVEVLNCSRSTALTCFPRASLEDALA